MRKLLLLAMLCPFLSMCQPLTIKGKIINEQGEPVSAATITIKSSLPSTVNSQLSTDANGNFFLTNIHYFDTLIITAVGYERATEIIDPTLRGEILVILKRKITALEEVVVNTGYQKLPRERATGSFTTVSSEELSRQVGTNILDRLNGTAGSVLFQSKLDGPGYMIRGLSTIQGPKAPLIVLDNFPYEGDIANINPADIENITILKDAAASSIWGARAGNGVVIITSKQGRFNAPLKINFSTTQTLTQKPDLFYLSQMATSDFIDVEKFLFTNNYYSNELNNTSRSALSPVVEILAKQRVGLITPAQADAQIDALRANDIRNEYNKYFYRQAAASQYALNLSGGSGNIAWYLSGGYDKTTSELAAPSNRLTLTTRNTYKPAKDLLLNISFTYSRNSSASGKPAFNSILVNTRRIPYLRFADEAGNPLAIPYRLRQPYVDTAGGGKLLDWNFYPLTDWQYNTTNATRNDMLGSLGLQYKFLKAFSIDLAASFQQQAAHSENLQTMESYTARNMINTFSQLNRATGVVKYIVPLGGIFSWNDNTITAYNLRSQLGFNKTLGNWSIASIAGAEVRQVKNYTVSDGVYGYNPGTMSSAKVDYVNTYPTYITGTTSFITSYTAIDQTVNRYVSFYGNGALSWQNKYTLSASARKDASNLFGLHTNEKWNPLWSAGVAWDLSKESFYHFPLVPYLKLRATYGFSGNVDPSKSAVTTINVAATDSYTNFPRAGISQFANPELRWEKVQQWNIGIDFRFRNDWLSGSVEYYRKKGMDLFGTSLIDYTAGLGNNSITKNVASMKGTGWDVELRTGSIGRKVRWNSALLLNYNLSLTTEYYRTTTLASGWISDGNRISPQPGMPLYSIISYQFAGLDGSGNPLGYLNGSTSTAYSNITGTGSTLSDLVFSGSAMPKYFGAWSNGLTYKNFSLDWNVTYKLGYFFRRETISYGGIYGGGVGHADFNRRWQKPGDEAITNIPSMIYPLPTGRDAFYTASDITVEKGDHIRLQFINLGYELKPGTARLFQSVKLLVNAANLGILWKANKAGLDPDYPSSFPRPKSFSIGLRAAF